MTCYSRNRIRKDRDFNENPWNLWVLATLCARVLRARSRLFRLINYHAKRGASPPPPPPIIPMYKCLPRRLILVYVKKKSAKNPIFWNNSGKCSSLYYPWNCKQHPFMSGIIQFKKIISMKFDWGEESGKGHHSKSSRLLFRQRENKLHGYIIILPQADHGRGKMMTLRARICGALTNSTLSLWLPVYYAQARLTICYHLSRDNDNAHPHSFWSEAEFLDVIGTKVLIVFFLAIHSHLGFLLLPSLEQNWFETGL